MNSHDRANLEQLEWLREALKRDADGHGESVDDSMQQDMAVATSRHQAQPEACLSGISVPSCEQ